VVSTLGCSVPPQREKVLRPPPAPAVVDCAEPARDDYAPELPVFDLYVNQEDWDALHVDVEADVEVDASVCFRGERYPIELELQGATARRAEKKSFDFKFNRGKRLPGDVWNDGENSGPLDKLILKAMAKDQSLIREAVAFDLVRAMGNDAPRNGFANLRINGDYWGLYVLVEPVDDEFLTRRGYPAGGTLYKATRSLGSFADFAKGRELNQAFENKSEDKDEDKEQEGEHDDEDDETDEGSRWEDLESLVAALQDTPLELNAFEREIDPIFSLEAYFDRLAWVSFTQNGDAVAQNFFLYNAPQEERDHWTLLPWDSDVCAGVHWRDPDRKLAPDENPMIDGGNHFSRRMLEVSELRARYVARFQGLLESVLTTELAVQRAHVHGQHIAHDLALDQERWERNMPPEAALEWVVDFFNERPAVLQRELGREAALGEEEPLGAD
jgi:spore coat protein H